MFYFFYEINRGTKNLTTGYIKVEKQIAVDDASSSIGTPTTYYWKDALPLLSWLLLDALVGRCFAVAVFLFVLAVMA